jgi:hypothetical protein
MRNFLGAYVEARLHNMYLYKGNLSFEYTNNLAAGCNAPLEALIDIDAIPHLRAMLVAEPVGPVRASGCEPCGPPYVWRGIAHLFQNDVECEPCAWRNRSHIGLRPSAWRGDRSSCKGGCDQDAQSTLSEF